MGQKKEKKYINVPLSMKYYEKLKAIAKHENRFVCRQASYFIARSIDNYEVEADKQKRQWSNPLPFYISPPYRCSTPSNNARGGGANSPTIASNHIKLAKNTLFLQEQNNKIAKSTSKKLDTTVCHKNTKYKLSVFCTKTFAKSKG